MDFNVLRCIAFPDNICSKTILGCLRIYLFFRFPKNNVDINVWCNLIKRQNNRYNFSVTPSHRVCGKHFEENFLFKPPGGTRTRLLQGAKPVLHIWNEFCKTKQRKAPKVRDTKRLDNDHLDKEDFGNNAEALEEETITEVEIASENVISNLKNENEKLKTQLEHALNQKLASSKLPIVSQIESSDELCNHYTGFTTQERLNIIYDFLNPGIDGENIILYDNQDKHKGKGGRSRALSPYNSFLVTVIRLRTNFSIKHTNSTVSTIFTTWINFIFLRLGSVSIWPSKDQVLQSMPNSMRQIFPNCRCIIDCAEFKVEVPSSFYLHKMLYSDYKSHTTVKVLVGITPGCGFNFISKAYPGSTSDNEITLRSGILNPREKEDALMADRGFTIQEYTGVLKIELIIPAFLHGRDQLSGSEIIKTQQIANERFMWNE